MICNSCNRKIEDDSKFCLFCGIRIEIPVASMTDSLWEEFVKLSFENDIERKKAYRAKMPVAIREAIQRFAANLLEKTKEENDILLDLSYETLEDLQRSYFLLAEDGYWAYMAEKYQGGNLTYVLMETNEIEDLVGVWKYYYVKYPDKGKALLPDEVLQVLFKSMGIQMDALLSNHVDIKKLPVRLIDDIKREMLVMSSWVYGCCLLIEKGELNKNVL